MTAGYSIQDVGIQLRYGCRGSGKTNTYLALWFQNYGRKEFVLPTMARLMGTTKAMVKV